MTLVGSTSKTKPRNIGDRSPPAPVHDTNRTSHTRRGSSQRARARFDGARRVNGHVVRAALGRIFSCAADAAAQCGLNQPVFRSLQARSLS